MDDQQQTVAATVKRASLRTVNQQRQFEKEGGLEVKVFLFDDYLGTYVVRPNREAAQAAHKRLASRWRIEHNKPKDFKIPEEQDDPLIRQAMAEHVGAFWDFLDENENEIPSRLPDGTMNKAGLVRLLLSDHVYVAPIIQMVTDDDAYNIAKREILKGN